MSLDTMAEDEGMRIAVLVRIGLRNTGMGRYGIELLRNLARFDSRNRYTVFNLTRRSPKFGANFDCRVIPQVPAVGNLTVGAFSSLSGSRVIGPELPCYDLVHSTLQEPGGPWPAYWASARHIWTMHDFVLELYPELTYAYRSPLLGLIQRVRRDAARAADAVVTSSETSKTYVQRLFGVNASRIHVVQRVPGREYDSSPKPDIIQQTYGIGEYMLILGTVEPRKNHARVLKAMAQMPNRREKLVIVGGLGWRSDEFMSLRRRLGLEERVLVAGYVPDSQLPATVKNAKVFLHPSLHEGSAPLLLDAMQSRVPIAASRIPEHEEAVGDAAVFADPLDTEDWAAGLTEVLENAKLREELKNRGEQQVRRYNWNDSCGALLQLFQKVGSGGTR